eukprot:1152736-Alexandrium_andersonii.AAC.1
MPICNMGRACKQRRGACKRYGGSPKGVTKKGGPKWRAAAALCRGGLGSYVRDSPTSCLWRPPNYGYDNYGSEQLIR